MTTLDLTTIRNAADRLGVHENTIRNWIKRGVIRGVPLPGSRYHRIPVSEIDRLRQEMEQAIAPAVVTDDFGATEPVALAGTVYDPDAV